MENFFLFIKGNISWIKSVLTSLLALVGTIIAILTYKKASATIFRTEVIKKQSELLTELLKYISKNENSVNTGLDYVNIAILNTFLALESYGFILKNQNEIAQKSKELIFGWVPCGDTNVLKDVEVISMFKDSKKDDVKNTAYDLNKEKFENAKKGIIEIDKIYITKVHKEFLSKIGEYADTPFLPQNIQVILKKIVYDVNLNLTFNLKNVLIDFMKQFCKKYFSETTYPNIEPLGVYNEFNHNRIHHRSDFLKLKKEIRSYLRIDNKW